MNTIFDMRQMMLELYIEALERYPKKDNEEDDIFGDMSEDELDRRSYITDEIYMMGRGEQLDFISLLILYYYSRIRCYKSEMESYDDEDDAIDEYDDYDDNDDNEEDLYDTELLNLIENEDMETVIDLVLSPETDYLEELISIVLDEDIRYYSSDTFEKGILEDFDECAFTKEVLQIPESFHVFEKFHPDLESEEEKYREYERNEYYLKKFSNIKIKSLGEFIRLIMTAKGLFSTDLYYKVFLNSFISNIKKDNVELLKIINIFMLKYYYAKNYLNNKDNMDKVRLDIAYVMEDIGDIDYELVKSFLDYDFSKFAIFSLLPPDVLSDLDDLISIDNTKTYGNDGEWRDYDKYLDDKNLFKYAPSWKNIISEALENDNQICVYYSKNENGDYLLPRLCLTISKDNKIKDVLGRDDNLSVEFELLNILMEKISSFSNSDEVGRKACILKYLSSLKDKISNDEELEIRDIDFLYEINNDIDDMLFGRFDYRFGEIRDAANLRRNLAKYFGCSEEEVAIYSSELNENTVVTTDFSPMGLECNFPKLKVIFGDAFCDLVKSAKGLSSLEFIKGNAYFNSLVNFEGLESLVRIDGSANFKSLEDSTHMNPDLVIKGSTNFNDDNEAKKIL